MIKKTWALIAPIVIIIIGLIGYMGGEGMGLYQALLQSFKLPKGYLDPLPVNTALEIARWLGITYIFSMFYAAIIALINSGAVFIRSNREDTVAVHGDSVYSNLLVSALGKKAIHGDSKLLFKAPTQVIFFNSDKDTLDFYQRNSEQLEKANAVYLCLNDTYRSSSIKSNVYVLNISESKAINYWQKNYLSEYKKIAIIGNGQLAENILYWGLQINVFDTTKNVDYAVYGDFERFNKLHPSLTSKMQDYGGDIITFNNIWYDNMDALRSVDRIILCGESDENIETATLLVESGVHVEIHVFIEGSSARTIFDSSNIKFFGDLSPEDVKELILMDKIHEGGKICNISYELYENAIQSDDNLTYESVKNELHTEKAKESWERLDAFTKGSNYSSALHDKQKYELLRKAGLDVSGMSVHENEERYNSLSNRIKSLLQEIEHIRWARYHFLNNWSTMDEKIMMRCGGKKKDPLKRLHVDLVPYHELTKEDQNKDGYFYKTLALRVK